jgi:hypothetical protein
MFVRKRLTTPWLALLMGLAVCVLPTGASAAGGKYEIASLKGLKGVGVVIEHIDSDGQAMGLSESDIRTDVELSLRVTGMKVLPTEEMVREPGAPYLYVVVLALPPIPSGTSAFTVVITLNQSIVLERKVPGDSEEPQTWLPGVSTWDYFMIGIGKRPDVHSAIKTCVSKFLNDYLTVNPKSGI